MKHLDRRLRIYGAAALAGFAWTVLAEARDQHVLIDPGNSMTVYANPGEGFYKSVDQGSTWTRMENGLGVNPSLKALAVDPTNGQRVYCTVEGRGFFWSVDGGQTWQGPDSGQNFSTLNLDGIEVSRGTPSVVYAWAAGPPGSLYLSQDYGRTFRQAAAQSLPLAQAPLTSLLACGYDGNSLHAFAGFDNNYGLYVTNDGGETWSQEKGSPGWTLPDPVSILWIDDYADTQYWTRAGFGSRANKVWVTDAFGGRWFQKDGNIPDNASVTFLFSHPAAPSDVYVLVEGSSGTAELYRSTWTVYTTNWTWTLASSGLGAKWLAGPAQSNQALWSAGPDGVRYSEDQGATWQTKLTVALINTPTSTAIPVPSVSVLPGGPAVSAFPNPASGGYAYVLFSTPAAGNVRVQVLNIAGRVVGEITATVSASGSHVLPYNLEKLANGVYVVYVQYQGTLLGYRKLAVVR